MNKLFVTASLLFLSYSVPTVAFELRVIEPRGGGEYRKNQINSVEEPIVEPIEIKPQVFEPQAYQEYIEVTEPVIIKQHQQWIEENNTPIFPVTVEEQSEMLQPLKNVKSNTPPVMIRQQSVIPQPIRNDLKPISAPQSPLLEQSDEEVEKVLSSLDKTKDIARCLLPNNEQPLSFYDVLDRALCQDPNVKDLWLQLKQSEIEKDESYAGYYPKVVLGASYGVTRSNMQYEYAASRSNTINATNTRNSVAGQLQLEWLLYDFGKREAGVKYAEGNYIASKMLVRSELQNIVVNTAQKYLQVLAARAYLKASTNNEKTAKRSYVTSREKRIAGVGILADELQAKNSMSSYEYSRIRYAADLKLAMGELASLLGLPITEEVNLANDSLDVPDNFSMGNVDQLLNTSLKQHPEILSAKQQILASEEALSVAQSSMLPQIYLSANTNLDRQVGYKANAEQSMVSSTISAHGDNSNIALNVSIPLFSGFSNYNQMRKAKNTLDVTQTQYFKKEKEIALKVWSAYQQLAMATENVKTTKELLKNAREAQSLAEGRYQSGVGNILEVLNTQNNLSQAEIYSVESSVNWHLSRLSLAASLGELDLDTLKTTISTNK